MRTPWCNLGSIPANGSVWSTGTIPLVRARTVTFTARVTFAAAADVDTTMNIYFSPDGNNWDTYRYATIAIPFTASATVQVTILVDPPEHGYLRVELANGDQTRAVTIAHLWYTIQSWDDIGADQFVIALRKALEKEKYEETGQP